MKEDKQKGPHDVNKPGWEIDTKMANRESLNVMITRSILWN